MKRSDFSLKALEVFCAVAQTGAVQGAAQRTGLSESTVSQHLRNLEAKLGVALIAHERRPMALTAQGMVFLRYVEDALGMLDKAYADLQSQMPLGLRHLRFALIEDFESDIGPEITRMLATRLPHCRLTHLTRASHETLNLLREGALDLGVATRPQFGNANMAELPLLRDPFVLAVPATTHFDAEAFLAAETGLPLLRYTHNQIIGAMIEAHLARLKVKLDTGFEFDSTSSMMALIAQGDGWAITTPSNYVRAKRFQSQVKLLPFPRKEFARTISVFVAQDQVSEVAKLIWSGMRNLLASQTIAPVVQDYPWLQGRFVLIDDGAEDSAKEF